MLNSALCLNQSSSSSSSSAVGRRRLPTAPATRRSSRPRPRRRRSCSALNCDVPSTMPPPPGLLRGVRTPPTVLRLRLHSPPAAGAWPPRARESVSTQYKATRSTRVTRTPGMGLRARRRPGRRGPRQASRGGRASHRVPRAHRLASPTPATWHTGPPHGLGRQLPIGGQRSGARRSGLGESLPWRGRRTHSPRHLRGTRRAEQQSPSLSHPRVKQSRRDRAEETLTPAPCALARAVCERAQAPPAPHSKPPAPAPACGLTGNKGTKGCRKQCLATAAARPSQVPQLRETERGPWRLPRTADAGPRRGAPRREPAPLSLGAPPSLAVTPAVPAPRGRRWSLSPFT